MCYESNNIITKFYFFEYTQASSVSKFFEINRNKVPRHTKFYSRRLSHKKVSSFFKLKNKILILNLNFLNFKFLNFFNLF